MEIQLRELIDQIKKDGVDAAEAEAEAILNTAKSEAEKIIADAQTEADKILENARIENARMVKSGEDSIRQAGRNLLLSFRESVAKELNAIVGENIHAAYSSDALAALVANVVERWAEKPQVEEISLIMNSTDLKHFEDTFFSALKDRISKGITLKANDNFDGGFRISVNDSGAYYDYSKDAVVEMMANYLSPRVKELLKEAE